MSAAIGKILRQAREERGLTIEQVAEEIYIRPHYLQAMEAGQFDVMPSRTQMRGFLRSYADFLHLDVAPFSRPWKGTLC